MIEKRSSCHNDPNPGNPSEMLPRDHHNRLRGLQVTPLAVVSHDQLVLSHHVELLPIWRESHREVQHPVATRRVPHAVRHLPSLHLVLALHSRLRGVRAHFKEDLLSQAVHSIRLHPSGAATHRHPVESHDTERFRGPHLVPPPRFVDHMQRYNGLHVRILFRSHPINQTLAEKDLGGIYRRRFFHRLIRVYAIVVSLSA